MAAYLTEAGMRAEREERRARRRRFWRRLFQVNMEQEPESNPYGGGLAGSLRLTEGREEETPEYCLTRGIYPEMSGGGRLSPEQKRMFDRQEREARELRKRIGLPERPPPPAPRPSAGRRISM